MAIEDFIITADCPDPDMVQASGDFVSISANTLSALKDSQQ